MIKPPKEYWCQIGTRWVFIVASGKLEARTECESRYFNPPGVVLGIEDEGKHEPAPPWVCSRD